LGSFFPWVAFAAGHRASLLLFLSQFAMAAHAHPVQVGLKPKAGLILMAGGTLDTFSIFFQFGLIHNVFSACKPVVAVAALEFGISLANTDCSSSRMSSG
jgi:hypothetical protein